MGKVLIEETTLNNIGNAIRAKTGSTNLMSTYEMPYQIKALSHNAVDYTYGFNFADKNLSYYTYQVDAINEEIILHGVHYRKLYEDFGSYDVNIPDTIGNYNVIVQSSTAERTLYNSASGKYGGFCNQPYTFNFNYGNNVKFLNNSINHLFAFCNSFNQAFTVPNYVNQMGQTFYNCISLNQPITILNGASNLYMDAMFYCCNKFNQPIEIPYSVSDLVISNGLFYCSNFNQPFTIANNNMNNLSMDFAFYNCKNFNQPLTFPNNVNNLNLFRAFSLCNNFNQPVMLPNYINYCNLYHAFERCVNFNKPITFPNNIYNWDLSHMFDGCARFNQPIVIPYKLKYNGSLGFMESMLSNCISFNQQVTFPNEASALGLQYFFHNCTNFNQPISFPNNINTLDMGYAFNNCTNFNQPIIIPANVWLANFAYAFRNCTNMTQNITIYSKNIANNTNIRGFLNGKDNSKRINIILPANSETNNIFRRTNSYSIVANTITWTSGTNYYYNTVYNIYIYPQEM